MERLIDIYIVSSPNCPSCEGVRLAFPLMDSPLDPSFLPSPPIVLKRQDDASVRGSHLTSRPQNSFQPAPLSQDLKSRKKKVSLFILQPWVCQKPTFSLDRVTKGQYGDSGLSCCGCGLDSTPSSVPTSDFSGSEGHGWGRGGGSYPS